VSGTFIVLEGIDGSGKTTVANRIAEEIRSRGRSVVVAREPGGTPLGEKIRALLLDGDAHEVAAESEALLFAASRAQLVRAVLLPALRQGSVVVVDRFVDSSLAYQSGGRGLPLESVLAAQQLATHGLQPDLKLLFDLPVEEALQRRFGEPGQTNRIDRETVRFHQRVRETYHQLAEQDPDRWRTIDANQDPEAVWRAVWHAVSAVIPGECLSPSTGETIGTGRD
jgi:dTMP kinase